jgi:hypothetical protein
LAKKRISTLFFAVYVRDYCPQKDQTPVEKLVDRGVKREAPFFWGADPRLPGE